MFTQKSIKIFHSVQEIRPFSLFQNLSLGKASTDDKCHFAIVSLFSEFEPQQILSQSQMSFDNLMGYILSISMCMQNFITIFHSVDNLMGYILSISMCMQNFITIFHSVQEIAPLSLFSEFGARQTLDEWKMSFVNLLGWILSISMFMQQFIKIFHSV